MVSHEAPNSAFYVMYRLLCEAEYYVINKRLNKLPYNKAVIWQYTMRIR